MEYSIKTKNINKDLKTIISQYLDDYKAICNSSRNDYIKTLVPGSPVPPEGAIYTDEKKSEFRSIVDGYRTKAFSIIDKAYEDLKDKSTAAPSSDAVNSIALLNMRKEISEKDISDLLNAYGDNYQAYSTINSIARDHGIKTFKDHRIKEDMDGVGEIESAMDKFINYQRTTSGRSGDGLRAMIEARIDEVFPVE